MVIYKSKKVKKSIIITLVDFFVNRYLHSRSKRLLMEGNRQLMVFSFDHIAHVINLQGVYESKELKLLIEWIDKDFKDMFKGTVLDIGANIGNHSLFFSDYFKNVMSFEPNNLTYHALSANAKLKENITIFNFGISNQAQELFLNVDKKNIGGSHLSSSEIDNFQLGQRVKLVDLDSVIDQTENISLIKIDVEGHELKVLEGAQTVIKRCKPLIVFELNYEAFVNDTSLEIELLKEYGYDDFAVIQSLPVVFDSENSRLKRIINFIFSKNIGIVKKSVIKPGNYYFVIAIPTEFNIR